MTTRRMFVTAALLGAARVPLADAKAAKPARIGFLGNGNEATSTPAVEALRRGLRDQGWIEGQTITIEYRWADGRTDRLQQLTAELVRAKIDVIVVSGIPAIMAAQRATRTIPVVFVALVDPVALGIVRSLARPGGNMTGLASQYEELVTKQLQLLTEAVPNLSRAALLRHTSSEPSILNSAQSAARTLRLDVRTLEVTRETEFDGAFKTAKSAGAGAMLVLPSPYLGAQRARLIEMAARYRMPAFYELRLYVDDGGLMSYGPSTADLYGRSATYVDRILKGANPGDLPIYRPERFELVINEKTARALGLVIPKALLNRADAVI
jgi:putative tryptophan/tyrosine transport system substrate-binding protein